VPEDDCPLLRQKLQLAVFKEPFVYHQKRGVDAWHQRCRRGHKVLNQGIYANMGAAAR
jgi:hypothetical protein